MPLSRAIPKMLGLENEYGCIGLPCTGLPCLGLPAGVFTPEPEFFVTLFDPRWLNFPRGGAWDPSGRLENCADNDDHGYFDDRRWRREMNYLLPNGGRFYLDMTHPEYCIPLCRNAKEAVLYDKAGEWTMNFVRQKFAEEYGLCYRLFKNNTAGGQNRRLSDNDNKSGSRERDKEIIQDLLKQGVSFGTHECHLVARFVPIDKLVELTLPFLVLRTYLIGSGRVGSNADMPEVDYQLSQRADFFDREAGEETMCRRPIYNLRDDPCADPNLYRRVHVISGDANMCEKAGFIKLATMQVLFMMIEDNAIDNRFGLVDAVRSFHQVSRDTDFKAKLLLKNGCARAGLDICKEYIDLMGDYLNKFNIADTTLKEGVKEAGLVLDKLSSNPEDCFGTLDHITKKMLIEARLCGGKISSWQDPRAKMLDNQYHNVNHQESLFYQPKIQAKMERITADEEILKAVFEGPPTRSRFQAEVCRKFGMLSWDWKKIVIDDGKGGTVEIYTSYPEVSWDDLKHVICDDRGEFIKRVREAGLLHPTNHRRVDHDEEFLRESNLFDVNRGLERLIRKILTKFFQG